MAKPIRAKTAVTAFTVFIPFIVGAALVRSVRGRNELDEIEGASTVSEIAHSVYAAIDEERDRND
jgi:hypothetical protein